MLEKLMGCQWKPGEVGWLAVAGKVENRRSHFSPSLATSCLCREELAAPHQADCSNGDLGKII